jgi:hypothetical protein
MIVNQLFQNLLSVNPRLKYQNPRFEFKLINIIVENINS